MAWACPLNFTDDFMYDESSRMNLEGYKTILPTNIQENASRFIGSGFILDQGNDPKHPPSPVKAFIRAKKWKVLDCPSSISRIKSDLNMMSPAEEESKGRNSPKQATIGVSCIKTWAKYYKG